MTDALPPSPDSFAAQELNRFLARELADLSRRVAMVERSVGTMLGARERPDSLALMTIQDLDAIRQSLEDLGRFSSALHNRSVAGETGDPKTFSELLRLSSLRERFLLGVAPPARDGTPGENQGSVALFRSQRDTR